MSLATLRSRRVAIYGYASTMDEASGVASSEYVMRASPDADGKWWASFGTIFGRERAPTTKPQDEQMAMFSFAGEVTIRPEDIIVDGESVYRVQSVMPRALFRRQWQAYCVTVDDANAYFLRDPVQTYRAFSSAFSGAFG
jgi:hypothetical protein